MNTILHSQNSLILKIKLLRVLLRFQIGQAGIKVSLKLLKILSPVKFKQKLAVQFYWKFIHNPNIEVENMSAFLERNILPMLGMRSAKVERNL
jgi:hypothetical protein